MNDQWHNNTVGGIESGLNKIDWKLIPRIQREMLCEMKLYERLN